MSRDYTTRTTCRVCGSYELVLLFSLGDQFVSNFVDEADVDNSYKNCPRCPLEVELCRSCTLVQLKHTAPQELLYSRKYWYRSGTSSTMRANLRDVAEAAQRVVSLKPGDIVLDIGSNDGTLLRFFPDGLVRVGVEPADNLATAENYDGLELVHDFWNAGSYKKHVDEIECEDCYTWQAKIVTACGMFYDLEDPNQFVADVAKVLHPEGVFVAQLMCLRQTVESKDVGNFAHEHLEYYSLKSLEYMLGRNGLMITEVETNDVNGGSYRLFIRHLDKNNAPSPSLRKARDEEFYSQLHNPHRLIHFYHDLLKNAQEVKASVALSVRVGKRVFFRGASTKGNVIAQFLGLDRELVLGAADVNPEKWGKFMVGTGVPIMSLEAVRQMSPDLMVVLPYAFEREIVEAESGQTWRSRGGKFLIPIPELRMV